MGDVLMMLLMRNKQKKLFNYYIITMEEKTIPVSRFDSIHKNMADIAKTADIKEPKKVRRKSPLDTTGARMPIGISAEEKWYIIVKGKKVFIDKLKKKRLLNNSFSNLF